CRRHAFVRGACTLQSPHVRTVTLQQEFAVRGAGHSPADAPRKSAVFFRCRLAKLDHLAAQLSVFRPVNLAANKSPTSIAPCLLHQCLELALTPCNPIRLVGNLRTIEENVLVRRDEKAASRLFGGAPAEGHNRQSGEQDRKSAAATH